MITRSDRFFDELQAGAKSLGMQAEHIARVWMLESGIDPTSHRAGSRYSGMNQSDDAIRIASGVPADKSAAWTSLEDWDQAHWILACVIPAQIKIAGGRAFATPGQYMGAQLAPSKLAAPRTPDLVIWQKSDGPPYDGNAPLDVDRNGAITLGDLDTYLTGVARRPDYAPIARRIAAGGLADPPPPPVPARSSGAGPLLFAGALGLAIVALRRVGQ